MGTVRRCLGCKATYAFDAPVCPKCGSCAGELQEQAEAKPKPKPRRKS